MSESQVTGELDDKLEQKVQNVVEDSSFNREEVDRRVEEKYEEYKERQVSAMDDADIRRAAVNSVTNNLLNISTESVQYEELPILTMGYEYREAEYFYTAEDALVAFGVVNPEDDPAGFATFTIESEHGLDLGYVSDLFEPLNPVIGDVDRRRVGAFDGEPNFKKGGFRTYQISTGSESTFRQVTDDTDFGKLPTDREDKRDLINQNFVTEEDHVTIQNYPEHVTAKNNSGYPLANGIDVKRMRGEVVDVYSDNETGFGVMTLVDGTVYDESDISEELLNDQMRTPGLQVFMDPSLLQYGEGSQLDVYGTVVQNDDGQFRMNGFGSIPLIAFDRNETESQSADDDIEEEMI